MPGEVHSCRWLLCVALAAALPAQDEGAAVGAFARLFRAAKETPSVDARLDALAALAPFDSPRVAAALAQAHAAIDAELQAIEAQRLANNKALVELQGDQAVRESRSWSLAIEAKIHALDRQQQELVQRGESARHIHVAIAERIAALRTPASLRFCLERLIADRTAAVPLRLAAAKALAAGGAAVVADVAAAIARARETDELVALIDALVLAGDVAQPHAAVLLPLLQHGSDAVRERAAAGLAHLPIAAAIEPMLALLQRSQGFEAVRVARALEVLTRKQFGDNKSAWQEWWRQEGASFVASSPPLGGGTPSARDDDGHDYYFGIPQQQSRAILYCLDCSGSMRDPVERRDRTVSASRPQASRLDGSKEELVRALGRLRPDQQFAILWYNDLPHLWQPQLVAATDKNVAQARTFVQGLEAAAMTNIHDALELGFSLAGRGARDRYYASSLDTIFLLTDGTPTLANGHADSTNRILRAVREWNPLQRVVVHTIGIGDGLDEQFLRELAEQNGGEFHKQ